MELNLPKEQQDALVIIKFELQCPMEKRVLEKLEFAQYITQKHGGGWMLTSKGREYIKRLK